MATIERDPRNTIATTHLVPKGHGGFAAEPQSVLHTLVANAGLSQHTQIRFSEERAEQSQAFTGDLSELLQRANISQASQTAGPNGNAANVNVAQPATQNTAPTPGH